MAYVEKFFTENFCCFVKGGDQLMYCLACQLQICLGHHRIHDVSNDYFVLLA